MMFRGASLCNVDSKGRFAVPTKYRARFTEEANRMCVMTVDTEDPCLLLYPMPIWEEIENKIQALPSFNRKVRRIQRLLIGHASETELDSQGRLLLPSLLREHAGIEKRMFLVGQGSKFEMWSEAAWLDQRKSWLEEGQNMRVNNEEVPDELSAISI